MPGLSGLELLEKLKANQTECEANSIMAHASSATLAAATFADWRMSLHGEGTQSK